MYLVELAIYVECAYQFLNLANGYLENLGRKIRALNLLLQAKLLVHFEMPTSMVSLGIDNWNIKILIF
jgi:hypothetical protein